MIETQKCEQIERVIELVYDSGVGVSRDMEAHVSICSECSAELASLRSVAMAVSDYKRTVFDPLPTPTITIHEPQKAATLIAPSPSWLESLLTGFGLKAAFAAAIFAVLIGTIAVFLGSRSADPQIAANKSQSTETVASVASEREISVSSGNTVVSETAKDIPEVSPSSQSRGKGIGTKAKKPVRTKTPSSKEVQNDTGLEEFADDSLRLSDLLQQIGG
jgi:hypothetical protein